MANIALTAAQIGAIDPKKATIKSYLAGSTITKGQPVSQETDGTVDPSDASTGGVYLFEQFRGIALSGGGAGQAIDVLEDGELYGFTVSGKNCGDLLYVSNDVGRIADAAGDETVYVGRVTALTDGSATKVARIQVIYSEAKAT
ncbi:hypothetical protein LCGC14_0561880 [marine sediment metagenome]|uniref:Uncharacterized protein n=1 Tax=marine sediment metagenome TaxID=412755 RepID=A0A0F9U884_9ZZZZ